jgi:hypothetical protein
MRRTRSDEVTGESVEGLLSGGAGVRMRFRHDPDGHPWAFVFSDREAYRDFLRRMGGNVEAEGPTVEVDGRTAFGTALGVADRIGVNTYSSQYLTYEPPQFAGLRQVLDAVEVEDALTRLQGQSSPDSSLRLVVRRYAAYAICLRKFGGEEQLVLRTDADGRELLTAFTFLDCLNGFREAEGAATEGELVPVRVTGEKLFALTLQQNLDGICFNEWGPAQRTRIDAELVRAVLAAE